MFVKDRMTKDPYTIQVSASINTLIGLMRDKKLRKVPVLDGEKLIGIVTDSDLFDALIDMMGGRTKGNKFVMRVPNQPGVMTKIGAITASEGTNITHFTMTQSGEDAMLYVITDQNDDVEKTREALESEGFKIENLLIRK